LSPEPHTAPGFSRAQPLVHTFMLGMGVEVPLLLVTETWTQSCPPPQSLAESQYFLHALPTQS